MKSLFALWALHFMLLSILDFSEGKIYDYRFRQQKSSPKIFDAHGRFLAELP